MLKKLSYKNLVITLCLFGGVFFLLPSDAQAQASFNINYLCSRHGGSKVCNGEGNRFLGPGPGSYTLTYRLNGHRHGSSKITADICFRSIGGGTGQCDSFFGTGSQLGDELGSEAYMFDLGWSWSFSGSDPSGYFAFYWTSVDYAEALLSGDGTYDASPAEPIPPATCDDPAALTFGVP